MMMLDHPFIVKLFTTYQDRDQLYFLLEPTLGGELFRLLRHRKKFEDKPARFMAASVVLAFEYIHSKNIIYRDLKPENLLVDDQGYLKMTDFGFAKIVKQRTWTLCGTPDYLAPEVVSGAGHGKGVDWWTLGILIFEMLQGHAPFYDDDVMKTYCKILHGQVPYPRNFSKDAIAIIKKFLDKKVSKRLGRLKGGAQLIREQPWFKGFDWDKFYGKQIKAPFTPLVKSQEDLSNFDSSDESNPRQPYSGDDKWASDF